MSESAEFAVLPAHAQQSVVTTPSAGVARRGTNGLAIASLACAIAGWFAFPFVGNVLALVFGYSARRQIAQSGDNGAALATAGIVLSWLYFGLVIAMVVLITVVVVVSLVSVSS